MTAGDASWDVSEDVSGDPVTWGELWRQTEQVLGLRPQARWLCEHACGLDGDDFLAAVDEAATVTMVRHLDTMVARYRAGEPLAYVMGRWAFRYLDVMVDRRVLIPRPETELIVDVVIEYLAGEEVTGPLRLVDLGTGSGVIGLSLAHELWRRQPDIWLTDVSSDALDVARANLAGLGRAGSTVRVVEGSWFDALPEELVGSFQVVVSNPPYVADSDEELDPSVANWEPDIALFAGVDGLDAARHIASEAPRWLTPGGLLALEIGSRQGPEVAALLKAAGLIDVEIRTDLAGRPRIAVGRQPKRAAI